MLADASEEMDAIAAKGKPFSFDSGLGGFGTAKHLEESARMRLEGPRPAMPGDHIAGSAALREGVDLIVPKITINLNGTGNNERDARNIASKVSEVTKRSNLHAKRSLVP